jgi:hypothetical protein
VVISIFRDYGFTSKRFTAAAPANNGFKLRPRVLAALLTLMLGVTNSIDFRCSLGQQKNQPLLRVELILAAVGKCLLLGWAAYHPAVPA